MSWLLNIFENAGLLCLGGLLFYGLLRWRDRKSSRQRALEVGQAVDRAKAETEDLVRSARLAAQEEILKAREQTEAATRQQQVQWLELERRLSERETLVNAQFERALDLEKRLAQEKGALDERGAALARREQDLNQAIEAHAQKLARVAGLSQAQAREELLKNVEQETLQDANNLSRRVLDEAKTKAEEKARHIISLAIQRYAGEHTFENTTATIALQGDEIKGRIIGREGRNIRAFEAATGVTVLIDDTPGAVLLSGFDPVRREIARESMARLIADGRIHPSRIEEVVAKVTQEMDDTILRLGEEAVIKVGLPPMHVEISKLLGRLHFRHSYSQNILDHSVEVAHLMALMAAELGVDVSLAKRAGLLHDIGKAVNQEVEGPHALVGADLIRRYHEPEAVVNGVASHHNDIPPTGPLGPLVSAADAISASRPGARSENMTTYLKRVEDLEKVASSFKGVEKAFAVQAGRELRVFVQPDKVDDEQAYALARNIATKVENELQYPGQIKVTVIRETRCVEVAK